VIKDTLKGPLREQVRVVENNTTKEFSVIAEFLDNYVSETQELVAEIETVTAAKSHWQKPAAKAQNLSVSPREFASLPINARLQNIASGTAPDSQGAMAWPPCPHCNWDRPNHSADKCRKKPGYTGYEGHTCPICKKEKTFHTPGRCWENPQNTNKPHHAYVARVSAGVALLSVLPKVCNNTDRKTTHKSSVNNTEFLFS